MITALFVSYGVPIAILWRSYGYPMAFRKMPFLRGITYPYSVGYFLQWFN